MTTTTIEAVGEIDLGHLAPHPRNVRRSLGDLKDLTRSIRDRGIETPLVVMPADGAGVHHIVAGHRRRAAAATAGLVTVPCLVRDFNDEADVVLSMIAENTQRSDGLNIVDEAQALAAVIDLRGGTVSARKLAAAVGHSEGWVRTRLALLCLPDTALDALHAAKISLDVATALTAAVDHPELIDQLVTQRGLSVWHVESAHRKLLADVVVSEAEAGSRRPESSLLARTGGERTSQRGRRSTTSASIPRLTVASHVTLSSSRPAMTELWSRSRRAPSRDATEDANRTANSSSHRWSRPRQTRQRPLTGGSAATPPRAAPGGSVNDSAQDALQRWPTPSR